MPELEASEGVDSQEAVSGADDALGTDDRTHEGTEVRSEEDSEQEAVDYAELDQETLIETLKQRDSENAKLDKSRREFQSMTDRKSFEAENKMSKLEGMIQVLASQKAEKAEPDPSIAAKEDEATAEKWKAEIEENPARAVDLVRATMANVDAMVEERVSAALSGVESKVSDLDPFYRENKVMIDALVDKTGATRESAIGTIRVLSESKSIVRQPPKVDAPGSVGAPSRITADPPKKPKLIELDAHMTEMANNLGLDEAAIKRLRTVEE